VLQSMGMRINTWWHRAHQGRVHLSSWANGHVSPGKLLRHSTSRCSLSRVGRHARPHGVAGNTRMSHPSGMPSEVWAHAGCHHLLAFQSRLSTVWISTGDDGALSHAHTSGVGLRECRRVEGLTWSRRMATRSRRGGRRKCGWTVL
jgi:hypothetical protein